MKWLIASLVSFGLVLTPVQAQGLLLGGDNSKTLAYNIQEGTPNVRDRYTLILPTLAFSTMSVQILYYTDFDGKIDPSQVSAKGKDSGITYTPQLVDLDKSARALTIQFAKPIPRGEILEIHLDEVLNPSHDGVYQIRGKILENSAFPAYRFAGDWFVTINSG